jgi:LysM repeat protein
MKITDLNSPVKFKINESRKYLYEGLDTSSKNSVMLWENAGNVLSELRLNAQQINDIFQQAEQGMTGQGANRTMLGKGKDATKAVADAYSDLKTKISNSQPVKDFDQKVSDVLSKIGVGAKDPQFQGTVSDWVQKYRDFATAHPIAQGAIYATLVAVAGLSGAGIAGAATVGLLKSADKLLQGERFSSAAYSGAKTGAVAGAAGAIGNAVNAPGAGQGLPDHPSAASDYGTGTYDGTTPDAGAGEFDAGQGQDWDGNTGDVSTPDSLDPGEEVANPAAGTDTTAPTGTDSTTSPAGDTGAGGDAGLGGGNYTVTKGDTLGSIAQANGISAADLQGANPQIDFSKPIQPGMNINLPPAGDNAGSVWQGYQGGNPSMSQASADQLSGRADNISNMQQAADSDRFTPRVPPEVNIPPETAAPGFVPTGNPYIDHLNKAAANGISLRESYIDSRQTARTWMLRESLGKPRGGVVLTPSAIRKINEGLMDWIKQKGKNLTNKVTADKLKQAWIKAKMPSDSEQIAQMLTQAGVGEAVIGDIYQQLGIPFGGAQAGGGRQAPQQATQGQATQQSSQATPSSTSSTAQNSTNATATKTAGTAGADQDSGSTLGQGLGMMGDVARGAASAVERGKFGLGGASDTSYLQKSQAKNGNGMIDTTTHTMYDKGGRPYTYKKVNGEWVDAQGGKVNPAFAASIDAQIKDKQTAATNKAAAAAKAPAAGTAQAKQTAGADAARADMDANDVAMPPAKGYQRQEPTAVGDVTDVEPKQPTQASAKVDTTGKTDYGLGKDSGGSFIFPGQKFDSETGQPMNTAKPAAQAKPATPDFSKALMGQNAGYGKVTMNAPTGASMNIPKATPGASVPGAKPTAPAAAPATASNIPKIQPAVPGATTPTAGGKVAQPAAKQAAPMTDNNGRVTPAAKAAHDEKVKAAWAAQHPGEAMPTNESKNFSAILWKQMKGL